jgi:hypothetical protein
MLERFSVAAACTFVALFFATAAHASGGNYVFAGGTSGEQAVVRAALDASAFDWNLVPAQVTIRIAPGLDTSAEPGVISLDPGLLDSGRFSWGIVQHEYAHQVDFFLLDDAKRAQLLAALGGKDWCYHTVGLAHSAYGCERFASTLAWAYWQTPDNCLAPRGPNDEAAAMPPAQFRALLTQMIGAPVVPAAGLKAYSPKARRR